MATVYNIELVSHWINYTKEELEILLKEVIEKQGNFNNNEITLTVKERK